MSTSDETQPRRSFLKALFGVLSGLLAAAVGVPVAAAFFDPTWRRTVRGGGGPGTYGPASRLPVNQPIQRDVIGVEHDAWDRSAPHAVGAVWLVRRADERVDAYSTACPHLGCPVGFDPKRGVFACPCHDSTFALSDGHVLGGPAPRGLDPLPVKILPDGRVEVTYERFILDLPRRIKS